MSGSKSDISARINKLMKSNGVKQVDVVKSIGATKGAVSKWVSGSTLPTGKYLTRLSRLLQTTPEYILTGINVESLKNDEDREKKRNQLIERLGLDDSISYDIDYLAELYVNSIPNNCGKIEDFIVADMEDTNLSIEVLQVRNNPENHKDYIENTKRTASISLSDIEKAGANKNSIICINNNDLATAPVIYYHANCFVDKSKTSIKDGKAYLIKINSLLIIREAYRNIQGGLTLRAYNDNYDNINVAYDEVQVIGWVFSYTNTERW